MITTNSVRKSPHYTCERCGLKAASPMVISKDRKLGEIDLGVCSNVGACERRQRLNAVRTPAAKP